jgi:restriction system protein
MAIPDYQTLMRPLMQILADGRERSNAELRQEVAKVFRLTDEELRDLVPSGQKPLFNDRLSWATSYLVQAGAITRVRRGVYALNDRGRKLLADNPQRIDVDVLEQFPEFRDFRDRSTGSQSGSPKKSGARAVEETATPEESLESAFQRLRAAIEAELLQQVKAASPAFFERLVVELLVAMGYGGSLRDAGQAIGRSGDGGIDGIIKEDRLGLEVIHVQAKRWDDKTVGRPEVQSFAGSLDGVRAKKGIFITTSSFSSDARQYVDRIDKRIVLIDGVQLASLMYDFGIGATNTATYAVRRVDSDYFAEE